MGERWTALVVDDAGEATALMTRALEEAGATVLAARTASEAIALLLDQPIDVALIAEALPGESGVAVLQHLRTAGTNTPVLLLVEGSDAGARALHFGRGADDVLVKPVHPAEVLARVRRRIELAERLRAAENETARLHALAVTDGLTGVANHRCFQERLREEFRRAQRYDDPLSLILLDLDHFKRVNDNFGHQVGDEVLIATAHCLKLSVRETDIVARYGGEEFAMLLPQTHLAGALTVAERVAAELQILKLATQGLRITGSFGVSGFPGRGIGTSEQLVRTADEALYRAKAEGRNKISLFQSSRTPTPQRGSDLPQ